MVEAGRNAAAPVRAVIATPLVASVGSLIDELTAFSASARNWLGGGARYGAAQTKLPLFSRAKLDHGLSQDQIASEQTHLVPPRG